MKKLLALILAAVMIPAASLALPPAQQSIEIRDIVKILSYENLLKLADMVDEYLVEKSGKTAFEIKLDAMSDAELLALNRRVQTRLFSEKLVNGVKVPEGVYSVGTDIPEGSYRVEMIHNSEYDACVIDVYDAAGTETYFTSLGFPGSSYEIGKLTIRSGDSISILGGTVIFYAYSGLFN